MNKNTNKKSCNSPVSPSNANAATPKKATSKKSVDKNTKENPVPKKDKIVAKNMAKYKMVQQGDKDGAFDSNRS